MGICGVDQASSLDMLVLQHEIIRYIESTMRQIDIDDEGFGFELVNELGPGGTFIDTMHTAKHFRKELWFPKLLDREYYQTWVDKGQKSCEERCRKMKCEILKNHNPEPVSVEFEKILTDILNAAKNDLGN